MIVIGGAGTLSMEMGLINTVRAGEDLLVVTHGVFGGRFIPMAKALGINVDVLNCPAGERVPLAAIEDKLATKKYAAMTLTHVDTSSGVMSQPKEVGELAKKYGVLFILDGVCASAGIAEPMKDYGIDMIVTTCQKAFGTPPGLTMLALSDRAVARREEMGTVAGYYTDIKNWLPIMDNPSNYFSTPPVNHVVALNESVKIILEEGIEERYARHDLIGRSVRAGLAAIGLEPVTNQEALAPTLSVVKYPEGIDDAQFRAKMEGFGLVVAGGVGSLKGKIFRIGHMGNISFAEIAVTLNGVERSLVSLGYDVKPGAAVGAASAEWYK
ncbi:Serine-pyruvate aminotransferase [bioreactor metagenome]|uniref:Serine-pyruvate aminotransferase n=1 Tax=bioreactor metagenome TaxID=1076179 RepID=A0A645CPY0_9ZZZZ